MCTVLAWSGKLPTGFLSKLLVASQIRGTHSTGVAWRDKQDRGYSWIKNAVSADKFVVKEAGVIKEAEEASHGIGHCRNASPNMPINPTNAHPFIWTGGKKNIVYAHNGAVRNWKSVRSNLFLDHSKITTDSMVLGPLIEHKDISAAHGSFGLVWLQDNSVRVMRSAKELEYVIIDWVEEQEEKQAVIACSLASIVQDVVKEFNGINSYVGSFEEGVEYKLNVYGVEEIGQFKVSEVNHADKHSSSITKPNERLV